LNELESFGDQLKKVWKQILFLTKSQEVFTKILRGMKTDYVNKRKEADKSLIKVKESNFEEIMNLEPNTIKAERIWINNKRFQKHEDNVHELYDWKSVEGKVKTDEWDKQSLIKN
jgi:hypothetical protein